MLTTCCYTYFFSALTRNQSLIKLEFQFKLSSENSHFVKKKNSDFVRNVVLKSKEYTGVYISGISTHG